MSDDTWLQVDYLKGFWRGKIHYAQLLKKKIEIDLNVGFLSLDKR